MARSPFPAVEADLNDPANHYVTVKFAPVTEHGHQAIQTVLREWLICPDDDILKSHQARYVYFYNV
jgi:hypothetical protein